jgi:hypothetical protein
MSGAFGGGSSGSGAFGSDGSSSTQHHGLLHDIVHGPAEFTGHLLGDVRDMAVGLPEGFAMLGTHPEKSLEQIGKTTWHDWSPLFHGDLAKFGHQFMAHPLAPILDIVGLVTGGAGLAAKGGELAGAAGLISKESKLAQLSGKSSELDRIKAVDSGDHLAQSKLTKAYQVEGKPIAYKHFDSNPAVRVRQRASEALGQHLAEAAPKWFGRDTQVIEGPHGLPSERTTEVTPGKVRDLTAAGQADRYFRKQESYRAGATKAAQAAQLATFVKAGQDITHDPGRVFRQIENHGRDVLEEHAYRVPVAQAKKLGNEFGFVRNEARTKYARPEHVTNVEQFSQALEGFAARHVSPNLEDAKIENGHALVVHQRAAQEWSEEGKRSAIFLTKLYKYPTQAWKYAVLATRPAYFVNNAVGNTFMAMATLGPIGFARGLVDAYRQVHGESATAKSLEGADKALHQLHGDWQDRYYLGTHQGFGQEAMQQLSVNRKIRDAGHDKTARVVQVAEQGFYPITHKVADVFLRRVMINSLMRENPAVHELMGQGVSFDNAAARVSKDVGTRDKVQEMVNNAMGDYHHFNRTESAVRQLVPFYSWDRAIARHGVHLSLDRTGRTAAGAEVGELGTQTTTDKLGGNIPSFMKGLLVLPGHGKDGRANVLSTAGLNPYASLPDVTDAAGAIVGAGSQGAGEVLASQLNPFITGLIESTTGQSLLSGAKLPHRGGGILGATAADVAENLPHVKLLQTLINGESQPKANARTGKITNFLYRKDARAQIAALLGVPVKELDTQRAADMADKAAGRKKGRHRAGAFGS